MTSSVTATPPLPRHWRPPNFVTNPLTRWALYAGVALYLVLGIGSLEVNWVRAIQGLERGWAFVLGFLQPNFTS
jgi:phosphonate transport system permease protein